jgi:hypothetical protein
MTAYDEEIRAVENRLARGRQALAEHARMLEEAARDAVLSSEGLLVAACVGYLLGEALHATRPSASPRSSALGVAAATLVRALCRSPAALARLMEVQAAAAARLTGASKAPTAAEVSARRGCDRRSVSMQGPQSGAPIAGGSGRLR